MCGRALRLCLLLWVGGAAVCHTRAQVFAPASLRAEVGRPLLLSCNITTAPGEAVRQVRWLDGRGELLLAYEQSEPVRVSHRDAGVRLAGSRRGASAITVEHVRPDDHDACYRCVFDVFPTGSQEGATCISVTGTVHLEGNKTAVSGRPASLSCRYSLPDRVRQVLWRKTAEQGDTATVASHTKSHHRVEEPFGARLALSRTLADSRLSVRAARTEDEACYTCEFHTYPDGTKSATACLSVYVLPKPEVTHTTSPQGVTEANCTAQSRPASGIAWDVGGDNRTLGPPVLTLYEQGDGTTVATSTLWFPAALLGEASVRCVVTHPGLDRPVTLLLNTNVSPTTVILLSVCGVAAVLLLCLCVCLCKCFVCTDD